MERLGLALCSNLVRQLGGDLVYEDVKDKGACFALTLKMVKWIHG